MLFSKSGCFLGEHSSHSEPELKKRGCRKRLSSHSRTRFYTALVTDTDQAARSFIFVPTPAHICWSTESLSSS